MAHWEQKFLVILSAILVAVSLYLLINDCIEVANDGSFAGKKSLDSLFLLSILLFGYII